MMKIYLSFVLLSFSLFFASCGNENSDSASSSNSSIPLREAVTDPLLIEIHEMEKRAKNDSVLDRNVGLRLLKAYQSYYNQHPQDTVAQFYLLEAARVADAMGKYQKAIDLLVNYHDITGNYNKKAEAAFLVAFIYDAHIRNPEKAIEYYNKVIELYPKSQWAEQAKSALHLVNMSDEDLMKFLDEKNKKAS